MYKPAVDYQKIFLISINDVYAFIINQKYFKLYLVSENSILLSKYLVLLPKLFILMETNYTHLICFMI